MKNVILEWFLCFQSAHFCEQRLRLVSALKHEKSKKNKKVEKNSKRDPQCGQPFWPRCRPRTWSMGHVRQPVRNNAAGHVSGHVDRSVATFVVTLRPCSTWPEHGPQDDWVRWPRYNVANESFRRSCFGHVRGHVSATFVATFRSRSWPRSNMIFEVFSRVF